MNPFDIALVMLLAYGLVRGIFRGLVKEVSSIVGVLAGYYAAYSYYSLVAGQLARWLDSQAYLNILSFLIIFISVFLLVTILGTVIKYLMKVAFLGWLDRICGAGFGLVKGILIGCVLFILLTAFLPKGSPLIQDSVLAPHLAGVSESMAKIVTSEMKLKFRNNIKELKKIWNPPD
jgi:membrane protein required for colicin V production